MVYKDPDYQKKYRERNREKNKEKQKEYYEKNKDDRKRKKNFCRQIPLLPGSITRLSHILPQPQTMLPF
jgi:nitrate reductase cytochrome c-type subunit